MLIGIKTHEIEPDSDMVVALSRRSPMITDSDYVAELLGRSARIAHSFG